MGEPKIEKIEDIEASLPTWEFLQKLPQQIGDFKKVAGRGREGQILYLVSYVDELHHRRLDLTYTKETFDYIPLKVIGLHSFRDERYYCRDKERFAAMMLEHLPEIIASMSYDHKMELGYAAKPVNFEAWQEWKELPKKIGSFELFITPDKPVNYINGSSIFLDYSDFEQKSTIYFLYNGFRVEVFGEMLQNDVPVTTSAFTVPQEDDKGYREKVQPKNILPAFNKRLQQYLKEHIEKLARQEFYTI